METNKNIIVKIITCFFLFSGIPVYGQTGECIVKMPEISGKYTGGCKKGLAHGKGTAQGIDQYDGQFRKGLPSGTGKYTWSDGTYYEGEWKKGIREGKGKMVYKDSTVTGFWKNNIFIGVEQIQSYKITRSLNVMRSSIKKTNSTANGIRIKLMLGSVENTDITDLSLAYDSGQEYHSGSWIGIQNPLFPVGVKISYHTWNQLRTAQYYVIYEFTINEPGAWEVIINN
jgi:hypothetical protein